MISTFGSLYGASLRSVCYVTEFLLLSAGSVVFETSVISFVFNAGAPKRRPPVRSLDLTILLTGGDVPSSSV